MKRPLVLICALAAAAMTACGGGGSSSNFIGPTPSSKTASVAFSITVPSAPPASSTQARRPQFTAPSNTQSVSIALTSSNGASSSGTPTVANLSGSSQGCTSGSSGLTCTVNVTAPVGNDVFTVSTFSQPNAQGTATGAGTVTVTTQAGTTTNAPTTLNGTIASVAVSIPSIVPEGLATSVPVVITAKDANGNTIIGTYSTPITLTLTDASKHTTLSATSIADSTAGSSVTIAYDGGTMSAAATIAPSVSGLSTSVLTNGSFIPNTQYPTVNGAALTYAHIQMSGLNPTPNPSATPQTYGLTVSTNATYNNVSGLVSFTGQGQNYTGGATRYYKWSTGPSSSELLFVGETSYGQSATSSNTLTESCSAPYYPTWTFPIAASANYGAGTGPCTVKFTDTQTGTVSVNEVLNETFNGDGSYNSASTSTFSGAISGTSTTTSVVNSDGTAVQSDNETNGDSYVIAVGTPVPGASTIPVWYQIFTASPLPSPVPTPPARSAWTQTIPNWVAAAGVPNGTVPSPLANTAIAPKGNVSLPSLCAVPSSVLGASPSVTEVDEIGTTYDPLGGYYKGTTQHFIVNGIGEVCTIVNDSSYIEYDTAVTSAGGDGPDYFTEVDYVTTSSLSAAARALHTTDQRKSAILASQALTAGVAMNHDRFALRRQAIMKRLQAHKVR